MSLMMIEIIPALGLSASAWILVEIKVIEELARYNELSHKTL